MASCRSCNAEILWAEIESGRTMPLDVKPTQGGTMVVIRGRTRHATREDDQLGRKRYTSHLATCPDAREHRRAR